VALEVLLSCDDPEEFGVADVLTALACAFGWGVVTDRDCPGETPGAWPLGLGDGGTLGTEAWGALAVAEGCAEDGFLVCGSGLGGAVTCGLAACACPPFFPWPNAPADSAAATIRISDKAIDARTEHLLLARKPDIP
jgi:hypothetical protein